MGYTMKNISIYTDGACSGNPGPGGWGAILIYKQNKKEISGYVDQTTNNRMELMAVLKSLIALKEPCKVDLYTDSAYVCNAFSRGWIIAWEKNGWKTSKKSDVENQDLWKEILNYKQQHIIYFHKVKGHSDNEYNNRCDELARKEIVNNQKNKQK